MFLCNGMTFCALLTSLTAFAVLAPCHSRVSVSASAIAIAPSMELNETNFIDDATATTKVTAPTPTRTAITYSSSSQQARAANVDGDGGGGDGAGVGGGSAIIVDDYVQRNQQKCFETRSLLSCAKYKTARVLWRLATNALGYFPAEHSRDLGDNRRRMLRVVQLNEPAGDGATLFANARSLQGDSEWSAAAKFVQRALETFGRNHGVQLLLNGETGARISDTEAVEPRLKKKKHQKWLILLPLFILMKIAHLKMTVVTLLLGVLGLNVLLVGGTAWLVHYLKFKTLCKIHPHLVQSHSHVYDSDPADYSTFVGSGHTGAHYGPPSYGSHEAGVHGWANRDWGNSKAYSGHNYLDTISKRLQ